MSPLADIEHQGLATLLSMSLLEAIGGRKHGMVLAGTNISDRETEWKKNFRCPDVAVFLPGNLRRIVNRIGSAAPISRSKSSARAIARGRKGAFYAKVGTRELLIVDRRPWQLVSSRLEDGQMTLVGKSTLEQPLSLGSTVLPVTFQLWLRGGPSADCGPAHRVRQGLARVIAENGWR